MFRLDLVDSPAFVRADCNGDGEVDLTGSACMFDWLFAATGRPGCIAALNTNGDVAADIADPVSLLTFLFVGGPAPIEPFLFAR